MKNKKIYISLFILILILVISFNHIRSFTRSFLPHSTKIMIKEIFFGKEYLEEINFYRQLGYNQEKLPNGDCVEGSVINYHSSAPFYSFVAGILLRRKGGKAPI